MEEFILQNVGNISLAGALLIIAIYYRPVLLIREQNSNARDERDHSLSLKRADVDQQTAKVLSDLKSSLDNGQAIAQMQHDTMRRLAEKVQEMTEDNSRGFERIKLQIDALPEEVWRTGDPRLAKLLSELKEYVTSASKQDEIIALLRDILAQLETKKEAKPKEAE